ncbi:MAG: hypothetical protein OXG35_12075, partial [Acidobacteria bacterium]|nr:hypothetical protein [Acidobacteriota bacterium]
MAEKVRSVQIDEEGHRRVEALAAAVGLTQATAAGILVRAAPAERVRQMVAALAQSVERAL